MLTRREFGKHAGASILALSTVGAATVLEGCSSNVFTNLLNWIPVGQAAITGIVQILESAGYVNPAAAELVVVINAGFTQLEADVKAYEALNPPPVGALDKVEAGLSVLVQNFNSFLASINVPNSPLLTTVIALVQVVLSTIAGFQNSVSGTNLALKSALSSSSFRLSGQVYAFTPQYRTKRAFKRDFNKICKAGNHPEIAIPLTFWEHL